MDIQNKSTVVSEKQLKKRSGEVKLWAIYFIRKMKNPEDLFCIWMALLWCCKMLGRCLHLKKIRTWISTVGDTISGRYVLLMMDLWYWNLVKGFELRISFSQDWNARTSPLYSYNLPQYGQSPIYFRPSFQLEYVKKALDRLVSHKNAPCSKVVSKKFVWSRSVFQAVVGHSKGGDLSLSAAVVFNDIIDLAIINSCMLFGPVFTDTTYKDMLFPNSGCTGMIKISHFVRFYNRKL